MTRQVRQGSQITNVEESAGSTSMATVVWWTRVAPARCTASAAPVRPPARARLQERGLLGRSQKSTTITSEQKLQIFVHVQNCIAQHLIYFATQVPRVYHLLAVGVVLANQQIEQWVEPAQGADACCVM